MSLDINFFRELLLQPIVKLPLPRDFEVEKEAAHLLSLWTSITKFQRYRLEAFVYAGGSGMVFHAKDLETKSSRALKIAREKLFVLPRDAAKKGAALTLSPVSEAELRALERITHPNVVRLFDIIASPDRGIVAIATTYIDAPQGLDTFIRDTLKKAPTKGPPPYSPTRLDGACFFLVERIIEVASALEHMHLQNIYHFDVKPANILISGSGTAREKIAVLTDMGSCIHLDSLKDEQSFRVHFSWPYAHPDLATMVADPASITGGGLKASATIPEGKRKQLQIFDLFALGKTLQEVLAIIEEEFGERTHSSYGFRFLHLVACLLLDGRNAPSTNGSVVHHGHRFVNDVALDYPVGVFKTHRIASTPELLDRLRRFSRRYSWNGKFLAC